MLLTIMTGPLPPGMLTIMVSLDGPPWGDVNPMTYTNKVINMYGIMYGIMYGGDVNPMTYTNKVINMSGVMYSFYT